MRSLLHDHIPRLASRVTPSCRLTSFTHAYCIDLGKDSTALYLYSVFSNIFLFFFFFSFNPSYSNFMSAAFTHGGEITQIAHGRRLLRSFPHLLFWLGPRPLFCSDSFDLVSNRRSRI